MKARGLALIIVIGILGVLAALAVAFVMMAQLERRASEQRLNGARAYLLARSGIEDALARLALGQDASYGGENWDADPQGVLSTYEAGQEVYRRTGAGTAADVDGCPVRQAMRPSFFAGVVSGTGLPPLPLPVLPGNRNPLQISVEGKDRGYSGALAGDYARLGNTYALKAGAEGSEGRGFYVNGGDPEAPASLGYNAVLRRMLGYLARGIKEDMGGGLTLTEADGWALIDNRPAEGWEEWDEVRDLALGGGVTGESKLAALRPYLALHAWPDKKVIAPNALPLPLPLMPANDGTKCKSYQTRAQMARDHRQDRPGSLAPGFERINGKIVGRAPVELSWARTRRPALIALLGNLRGLYLDELGALNIQYRDRVGTLLEAEITLSPIPAAVGDPARDFCHKVADRILSATGELDTWQQWNDFCDSIPDEDLMSAQEVQGKLLLKPGSDTPEKQLRRQAARDILKANFNPNSDLNKFNPNRSLWRSVDKQDLLVYSTEFSLLDASFVSAGHQEISSAGRVLDRRGRLLASRVLKAILAGPPPLRLTTQKEFVAEDLGALDLAGDETDFRLPGQGGGPFISLSQGAAKTWGHALPGLGGRGSSLQTYPEPCVDPGSGLTQNPADYDGALQLATIETASGDTYDVGTQTQSMMLLARYTASLDLDVAAAYPANPQARLNQPDLEQVRTEELGMSVLASSRQNNLYPDGCYAEKDRAPAYLDKGNANGFHGLMSFWIKASYRPTMIHPGRGHPFVKWTNFSNKFPMSDSNQFFILGDVSKSRDIAGGYIDPSPIDPYPGNWVSQPSPDPWRLQDWLMSEAWALPQLPDHGPIDPIDPDPIGGGGVLIDESYLLCQFEIGHGGNDKTEEHRFQIQKGLIPHRWQLLSYLWNFRAPGMPAPSTKEHDTGKLFLDSGAGADKATTDIYWSSNANDPNAAEDITQDDIQGPHLLSLGRGHPDWERELPSDFGSGADSSFGEFALYDFGGAGPGGAEPPDYAAILNSPAVLAAARFKEGRYYKESAYNGLGATGNTAAEWFSAPIALGPIRLLGLSWTQIVPPELRSPLPVGSAAEVAIPLSLAGTPVAGDLPPDGAISFELVNAAGTEYVMPDRPGLLGTDPQRLTNPAFTPVNRSLRGPFRLHAVFQPNLADPENTPILDPLTLDDVTLYYEPLSGLRVLAYETDAEA